MYTAEPKNKVRGRRLNKSKSVSVVKGKLEGCRSKTVVVGKGQSDDS